MTEAVPNEEAVQAKPEPEFADRDDDGPGRPPPTALESLVNALLESGPEVAEHVVRAAQELLLAAHTIVDAAERAVEEQQDLHRPAEETPGTTATVHPIDRTE
jgi:hypothetical protein